MEKASGKREEYLEILIKIAEAEKELAIANKASADEISEAMKTVSVFTDELNNLKAAKDRVANSADNLAGKIGGFLNLQRTLTKH